MTGTMAIAATAASCESFSAGLLLQNNSVIDSVREKTLLRRGPGVSSRVPGCRFCSKFALYRRLLSYHLHIHHVRSALRTREHAVRFVVILEVFLDRVPIEPSFRLHRDVVDEACRAGPVPDLRRR